MLANFQELSKKVDERRKQHHEKPFDEARLLQMKDSNANDIPRRMPNDSQEKQSILSKWVQKMQQDVPTLKVYDCTKSSHTFPRKYDLSQIEIGTGRYGKQAQTKYYEEIRSNEDISTSGTFNTFQYNLQTECDPVVKNLMKDFEVTNHKMGDSETPFGQCSNEPIRAKASVSAAPQLRRKKSIFDRMGSVPDSKGDVNGVKEILSFGEKLPPEIRMEVRGVAENRINNFSRHSNREHMPSGLMNDFTDGNHSHRRAGSCQAEFVGSGEIEPKPSKQDSFINEESDIFWGPTEKNQQDIDNRLGSTSDLTNKIMEMNKNLKWGKENQREVQSGEKQKKSNSSSKRPPLYKSALRSSEKENNFNLFPSSIHATMPKRTLPFVEKTKQ